MKFHLFKFVFFLTFSFFSNYEASGQSYAQFKSVQVDFLLDYFDSKNEELKILLLGGDVSIIQRDNLDGIVSHNKLVTSKFDMNDNVWPMSAYYGGDNYVVLDSHYNVIFSQFALSSSDNHELFNKLPDLEYVSLIANGDNITVDLSSNFKLKEFVLKNGSLNKVVLPKSSAVEVISAVSGSIGEIVNLDTQNKLISLRVGSNLKNISDINESLSLERLIVFPRDGIPEGLKVSTIKKIKHLMLYDDNENDINGFDNLNHLNTLLLVNMNVEKVKLPSTLKLFDFSGVENKRMPEFPNDSELLELYISNTSISKINELENLGELKMLSIYSMPLKEISGIEGLHKLERLDIEYTDLDKIQGLGKLNKLTYLKLRDNKFKELSALTGFKSCEYIDVSYNVISKIEKDVLSGFFGCPIALFGNPVYDNADYSLETKLIKLSETGTFDE
ncbi:hypothetical protein ACFFLZ_12215 [Photobacterium aphoticum]|uniref:Leucine-rich repeat domain-containing protein n=1 Tax=Photobacterium aphoticum TaxID=754436 RepID=A0A0J1JHW7_9GAMM|nr:hypothetical protein [Photobacterium aphoticum]KLV01537.1 hypothetical protein ABT58_07120 [Photobacterium aphoticum]PSU54907.1 hypothetical protein C9I90_18455 [Photobacterium aphoticum]GHA43240.1 hypothetical protein GCM10007086_15940 [Photobacterium aphoticum]